MKKFTTIVLSVLCFLVGIAGGAAYYLFSYDKIQSDVFAFGEIEFHFMELGNGKTGDSVYIKCGDVDILVDAGSRTNSADTIEEYVKGKMTDDKLDFAIVTHADQDHIACFAGDGTNPSLFTRFDVGTIIDFPKTGKSLTTEKGNPTMYADYLEARAAEIAQGAKHYTALECYKNEGEAKRSYQIGSGTTLNILYNYYYENESNDENNYSVCFQIEQGEQRFLFTGDLEEKGEEYLVEYNQLEKVVLFKAGHHGSPTSSNDCLLDVIQPEICVACCCAGSVEYTDNLDNTFPSQAFINRISKWTDQVYAPTVASIVQDGTLASGQPNYKDAGFQSLNGNIVVSVVAGDVSVNCSNNNTILKHTDWFKEYRTWPSAA